MSFEQGHRRHRCWHCRTAFRPILCAAGLHRAATISCRRVAGAESGSGRPQRPFSRPGSPANPATVARSGVRASAWRPDPQLDASAGCCRRLPAGPGPPGREPGGCTAAENGQLAAFRHGPNHLPRYGRPAISDRALLQRSPILEPVADVGGMTLTLYGGARSRARWPAWYLAEKPIPTLDSAFDMAAANTARNPSSRSTPSQGALCCSTKGASSADSGQPGLFESRRHPCCTWPIRRNGHEFSQACPAGRAEQWCCFAKCHPGHRLFVEAAARDGVPNRLMAPSTPGWRASPLVR